MGIEMINGIPATASDIQVVKSYAYQEFPKALYKASGNGYELVTVNNADDETVNRANGYKMLSEFAG